MIVEFPVQSNADSRETTRDPPSRIPNSRDSPSYIDGASCGFSFSESSIRAFRSRFVSELGVPGSFEVALRLCRLTWSSRARRGSLRDIAEGAARKPGNRDCHGHSRARTVNIGLLDRRRSRRPEQIALVLRAATRSRSSRTVHVINEQHTIDTF